jgi:hypothetical protein
MSVGLGQLDTSLGHYHTLQRVGQSAVALWTDTTMNRTFSAMRVYFERRIASRPPRTSHAAGRRRVACPHGGRSRTAELCGHRSGSGLRREPPGTLGATTTHESTGCHGHRSLAHSADGGRTHSLAR